MTKSGVMTEEHDLNYPREPQSTLQRWIQQIMEARRYQDGTGDPDYNKRLRELEGQIEEIDREQRGFRMGDYHEGGGGKWDKWAMPGLVTLAVSGIIGNVVQAMQVSALRQEVTDLKSEVTDIKKLVEPRYRGQ
jgi:hypothetical protein